MPKKMLIITKHLDIGGAEKMLLRFLPVFISLGYKIDLYLLYNYRMQMDFEFDLGYTSNQIELFSIFPYKTNDYKQFMKNEPQEVYYSVIHDTVKIKNRKKLHGFILIFKNIIFLQMHMIMMKKN